MAKRARTDEEPFNPVSAEAVRNLMAPQPVAPPKPEASAKPEPAPAEAKKAEAPAPKRGEKRETRGTPRSTKAAERREEVASESAGPTVERMTRPKRVLLTPSEAWDFDQFVHTISGAARVKIPYSHLMRVLIGIAAEAQDEIAKEVEQEGPLSLPVLAEPLSVGEFENRLEGAFRRGLAQSFKRRSRPD